MENRATSTQQPKQAASSQATADRDQITERAYYRYVERGRTDGRALDDWLSAETEIRQQASHRAE